MKTIKSFLLLLIGTIAVAQTPDKAKLDQYWQAIETHDKFSGNAMLSQNGQPIYSKSVGFADVETGKRNNIDTKFRIGSITKMFTTVLIFKAVEDKKLLLSDKLDKWFPQIPNAPKITIGHMLSHRSGIHNFTDDDAYETYMTQPHTQAEMVAIIAKPASDFEPDSKADYSNSNFILLTYIVEKTFKKPYAALIQDEIIKPLKLKNTYYGGKINPANNEAYSYKYQSRWTKDAETDMSIPAGAGAIVSNVNDLSRFIEALFDGKLVSAASLGQMKTIRDGYGMGMFEVNIGGKTGYGHNGGIDSFTSMLAYFPEDKTTLAFTSNGRIFSINKMAKATLDWLYGKPFEIPEFKTYDYKNTTEALDPLLGTYSSPDMPMKITITKENTTLIAQATGQSSFPLDAAEKNIFRFDTAGIVLEFNPAEKKMVLKQGGGVFNFTKE
jgi:CubicO group peptidase (beta-lactamase class C family)